MLSTRRIRTFYILPMILFLSGIVVWLGDINWWDDPVLSPSLASPIRMTHTLFGFGMLTLFGTVYWHSKVHWRRANKLKKIAGISLWVIISALSVTAIFLLYGQESLHIATVIIHAIAGGLLALFLTVHQRARD